MRLLSTRLDEELKVEEFFGNTIPQYVILSHTWETGEVTFQDVGNGNYMAREGFEKIKGACAKAAADGYDYIWIDACCIDKSSSSELSESINSMYGWYKKAELCYAYLADLDTADINYDDLKRSKWFTRGWTLQELVAPPVVEFYAADWKEIGTKLSLKSDLARITGIDSRVLEGAAPSTCNVAQRMSWASKRHTTREEDIAYCLLGLFDVNMPLLYGEGGDKAFARLQEQILKDTDDYTLFLWTNHLDCDNTGLLARSPAAFCTCVRCYLALVGKAVSDHGPYAHFAPDADFTKLPSPEYFLHLFSDVGEPAARTSRGLRIAPAIGQVEGQTIAYIDVLLDGVYPIGIELSPEPSTLPLFSRNIRSPSRGFRKIDISDLLHFERRTIYVAQPPPPLRDPYMLERFNRLFVNEIAYDHQARYLFSSLPDELSLSGFPVWSLLDPHLSGSGVWNLEDMSGWSGGLTCMGGVAVLQHHHSTKSSADTIRQPETIAVYFGLGATQSQGWCVAEQVHLNGDPKERYALRPLIEVYEKVKPHRTHTGSMTDAPVPDRSHMELECGSFLNVSLRRAPVFFNEENFRRVFTHRLTVDIQPRPSGDVRSRQAETTHGRSVLQEFSDLNLVSTPVTAHATYYSPHPHEAFELDSGGLR